MSDTELKQLVKEGVVIKRGDRVRLLKGGGRDGLRGFNSGAVYTVDNPKYKWGRENEIRVQIRRTNNGPGYAHAHQLEVVHDE